MTFIAVMQAATQQSVGDTAANSLLETVMTLGGTVTYGEMWLWLTLVMLIVEIFTAGFFVGAFAVSTVCAALASWLGVGRDGQILVFCVVSIASLIWIRPLFVRILSPQKVETNAASLVGQPGTVIDSVPAGGYGRVRLSNEEWRATCDSNLSVGDVVRVLAVKGNTLTVGRAWMAAGPLPERFPARPRRPRSRRSDP